MMPMQAPHVGIISGGIDGEESSPVKHVKLDDYFEDKKVKAKPVLKMQSSETIPVVAPLSSSSVMPVIMEDETKTEVNLPVHVMSINDMS